MARYHSLVGRGKILDRRNGGEADADAAAADDSPQVFMVLGRLVLLWLFL